MQTTVQQVETISRTLTTQEVLAALGAGAQETWNGVSEGQGTITIQTVIQQPPTVTGTV